MLTVLLINTMTSAIVPREDVSVPEGNAGVLVIILLSIVQMAINMKLSLVPMVQLIAKTENVFLIDFNYVKPFEPFLYLD